ncbi:MAG: CBS domain-containing protein [Planctomycetota bacterium]|nr:MAG: CBS domain-containing protein [Planctomycetota bacterium]
MKVRDVMQASVRSVPSDATAREVAVIMRGGAFRHVPVVDPKDEVVGIVSDRDLLNAGAVFDIELHERSESGIPAEIVVSAVMTENPITIGPDAQLADAVSLLADKNYGALPVVDQGRLVGILSYVDLLRVLRELLSKADAPAS